MRVLSTPTTIITKRSTLSRATSIPSSGPRTIQWADIGGRKYHVIAGRVSRAVVNPTFDPVAKPGALHAYFRGNPEGKHPLEFLRERERIRPEYRDRDARLATLDAHGSRARGSSRRSA
jgi:hypothetical protein